jgi:predicted O-linked N-acetylglucosamine transferase (SPINDLY family)
MAPPTIQRTFDLAVEHHQAGRLHEAEQLYRHILAQQPEHADAVSNLGVIAQQIGRNDLALDCFRRAIALRPGYAEAHCNLGVALKDKGQLHEAIAAYRQAIALRPDYAEAHANLGNALKDNGQLADAIAAYRQAIAFKPDNADAFTNLGIILALLGQLDEAVAAHRRAIALRPDYAQAHNNLGVALAAFGELNEAIAAHRQAIALNPNLAEAYGNLAHELRDKGELHEAIAAYRKSIVLRPNDAQTHNDLANELRHAGQLDEAIAAYRQAIFLRPDFFQAHSNLGVALTDLGQLDDAVAAFRSAISLMPGYAEAHSNLGNALKDRGELEEAIAAYRQAIALNPNFTAPHDNLLFALHYHPGYDARAIAEEHRRWNRQHAHPLRKLIQAHANDRDPHRRLRIGYVSPDFRDHCQSFFTVPLLSHHDHQNLQIVCYADVLRPDPVTARLQSYADLWRNVVGLTDEQLALQIRQDQIDILIDLTMHMAHNRLLVFARKPAPVQVCWLAYPASTGLGAIDYRLSDPYLDPPGMDESIYSERTVRLPDTFWCYDPLGGRNIPVNTLPALQAGFVTFGCLNNFCKINDDVLILWAQVLRQVPNSRLKLLASHGNHRRRTLDRLSEEGIAANRVEFVPRQSHQGYLELYHRIDLALDTFPYNGHTTSLDSFWMGVPVVTLVGQTAVTRAGWCQLSNLGLTELAAHTPEQFVRIAAELAADLPGLSELRRTLRSRMEHSPLMDAPRFASNVEAAYRQMWHTWCQAPNAQPCDAG